MEEKIKILEKIIDKKLASEDEQLHIWATGAYWMLGELGYIDGWVEDKEVEKELNEI